MIKSRASFKCPEFYDLRMTCHTHGWKNLAPFSWDSSEGEIRFSVSIDGQPIDIKASQARAIIKATLISNHKLSVKQNEELTAIIKRCLSLEVDTSDLLKIADKIGPQYVPLIERGAGRLLRSPTLWEDAAKTLFTTNCSWTLTKKICNYACSKNLSEPTPLGFFPFPLAERIAKYSSNEIREFLPIGYRSRFLKLLAKKFAEDPTYNQLENKIYDYKVADNIVRHIKGFADYATAHLLLLAGYYNEVPIDTVVTSYLKKNHRVRKPKSFIDRQYRKWGKYKWWGLKLEKMLNQQNWLGD